MPAPNGSWYVRLPDGRVVLARSTQALRYHIERGRIPANSRVRRSVDEKWQSLDVAPDFADLLAPPAAASDVSSEARDNGKTMLGKSAVEYRAFGVAALVNELFNAVDLSLHRQKLWIGVLAALACAVSLVGVTLAFELAEGAWRYPLAAAIGLSMFFIVGLAASALAQMTLVEMLHRRRPHWSEIRPRLLGNALNIMFGQMLFLAGLYLPIVGLRRVPLYFAEHAHEILLSLAVTLRLIIEIFSLPVASLALLLVPIMVVEECSLPRALKHWWELLRNDLSRIFLYETLALALGVVLTLPLIAPVLYAAWDQSSHNDVAQATLYVIGGLAMTPFAAYLVVANVFIYLNLRYEFFSPTR